MTKNYMEFLQVLTSDKNFNIKAGVTKPISIQNIEEENKRNDIYFLPNTSKNNGYKDEDIIKFNCCFIDLDAGRDKNKKYKDKIIVDIYKQDCMAKINNFLASTFIVETRNGYHVYWRLKNNENIKAKEWIEVQEMLIKYFNSDPAVKNPARLMRLPFTNWMKDKDNPFPVTIADEETVSFELEDLKEAIKSYSMIQNKNKKYSKVSDINTPQSRDLVGKIYKSLIYVGYKNPTAIKANDIKALRDILTTKNNKTITFKSFNECYKYITTQIDLAEYLSIDNYNKFNCIFHDDKTMSASIYKSKNGEYMYKCFSSNCDFGIGNIIKVTEAIKDCTTSEAIEFIKKVYNLRVEESEWVKAQITNINSNIQLLVKKDLEETEPTFYNIIKRYTNNLVILNEIARQCVFTEDYKDKNGNVLFFFSDKYFKKEINSLYSNSNKVPYFVFLKLINRVDDKDIPKKLRDRAIVEAAKNETKDTVQYYSMPSYSYFRILQIIQRAKLWKKHSCTMRGMSREMLLRTFGEEIADEVYPKRQGRALKTESYDFQDEFEKLLIKKVEKKGYALEKDIIKKMDGFKTQNEIQTKRILDETLKRLNMQRVRLNKSLKDEYKVKGNGYPFIIIKRGEN